MQQITTKELGGGVTLTCLTTEQFKASALSAAAAVPLQAENAAAALLPQVLARGTAEHPDLQSLGEALDGLYGARIAPFVRKIGENLAIGFLSDVIDGAYASSGDDLTSRAAALIGALWNAPYLTEEGTLCPDYTAGERQNLADRIRALPNDTRTYAPRRMQELMCAGEPFGYCEYGSAEGAEQITAAHLTEVWRDTLAHAPIHLFYCGSATADAVATAFGAAFDCRRAGVQSAAQTVLRAAPARPHLFTEEMDVRQGKLAMGFRTGLTAHDSRYAALMLFVTALGGYTGARLFCKVREEMSLCYYASASLDKLKGIMTVSSGIENTAFETARDAILQQLYDLQQGGLTADELEGARRTLLTSLRQMEDSPFALERFYQSQAIGGVPDDLQARRQAVAQATMDEVLAAGRQIELDTIYFLKGVAQ